MNEVPLYREQQIRSLRRAVISREIYIYIYKGAFTPATL